MGIATALEPSFVSAGRAGSAVTPGRVGTLPDALAALGALRRYAPRERIAIAGDEGRGLEAVSRGVVSLSRTLQDGRRQIVGLLFPGDVLADPWRRSLANDADALSEAEVVRYPAREARRLAGADAEVQRWLLANTLASLDDTREWMLLLGRKTARERIASLLLLLADRQETPVAPGSGERLVPVPMSRERMAELLGLTIETVSRQFTLLRRDGLIALSGGARQVRLCDEDGLREAAGAEAGTDVRRDVA